MQKLWLSVPVVFVLAVGANTGLAQEKAEDGAKQDIQKQDPAQKQEPAAKPDEGTKQEAQKPEAAAKADDATKQEAQKQEPAAKADEGGKQAIQKQDPVPPATGRNLPEQAGTTEPSSKVAGTAPNPNVFEKGVLTVPGARTDVDTAPAKFFARTDADDQLPIAGYRLKHLTADQRREIASLLGDQRGAAGTNSASAYAVLGAEVPSSVAQQALAPVPENLTSKFPELRGTAFMRAANKLVVVDMDNNQVVGVLEG
jgi:hypothetical protein